MATGVTLILALLAVAWIVTLQRLEAEKILVSQNTRIQQENLATIISENLAQVLDRGRLISIAANEWFEGDRADATNRLSAMRAADRAFLRIALYDTAMRRVYTSSPATDTPELQNSLRLALNSTADDKFGELRVGSRPESHEQAWQLPLLFPVRSDNAEPSGLLLVVLDLGYFLSLYQQIDIGRSGIIQIINTDGKAVAEARQEGLVLSGQKSLIPLPLNGTRHGSLNGAFFEPERTYQTSFHRLEHHPFFITVSRSVDEALAEHGGSHNQFLSVLAVFTAIIALATIWFARSLRRQGRLLTALARADEEKRELIIQLEEEKQHAFKLAAHDHLTGLSNRRMFHQLVVSHLSHARRSRKHYALMYVDLDHFKEINDSLGHHVGDLVLQTVSARLQACLRESDVIARLGGDEFGLLLTGLENIDDTASIAAKIVDQVGCLCRNLDGNDIQVTPSIGIAIFPRDGEDFDTLCRNADAAMYQSKRSGRGQYTFYDSGLKTSSERLLRLEQGLPKAIADDELTLHFQPTVRLSDCRIVGFEALVRWEHPEFGLIYPDDFIPLAEQAGIISELGDWVARACCRQLAEWQAEGLEIIPIACNVSARQLQDKDLPRRIAGILKSFGVDARFLEIEITENNLIESIEIATRVLGDLEALGVRIALNDFGNGLANFAHIRSLPIHCLKIDRTFINDIRNNHEDAVIVAAIIALAHNLHLKVIAEGVEMADQMVRLKTAGCDEAQGHYFSHPVPADSARKLLIRSHLVPE